MSFQYNDGGRKEAGWQGSTGDCVVRSIAIAASLPYQKVYDDLAALMKACKKSDKNTSRNGVQKRLYHKYILSQGFVWVPTMGIGTGCTVHVKADELPSGRLILRLSKHLVACVDKVVNDTYDCTRDGTRCVYGYYKKSEVTV